MSEWFTTAVIAAPLCALGYYAHKRVRTHGYAAIAGEFVLGIILLNFCSAWVNASAIVQDDVRKWQKLVQITCPHSRDLGAIIQQECNAASKGLERTWIGLFVTAMGDIGWLVVLLRVDVLGAFYAVANAHVGVWTTAMTLIGMGIAGLIGAASFWPVWKRRPKTRTAQPRLGTTTTTTCKTRPSPLWQIVMH